MTTRLRAVWRSMDQGDQMAAILFTLISPIILVAVLAVLPN